MVFPKNALMCIKKVKLINHDCLPILMMLYIMLHVMFAYLIFFAALSNAVCLHNAFFFFLLLIYANAFCFMLCLGLLTHSLFISSIKFISRSTCVAVAVLVRNLRIDATRRSSK